MGRLPSKREDLPDQFDGRHQSRWMPHPREPLCRLGPAKLRLGSGEVTGYLAGEVPRFGRYLGAMCSTFGSLTFGLPAATLGIA